MAAQRKQMSRHEMFVDQEMTELREGELPGGGLIGYQEDDN
jgi:hypothetical protein